jgi:hypothetical protein
MELNQHWFVDISAFNYGNCGTYMLNDGKGKDIPVRGHGGP